MLYNPFIPTDLKCLTDRKISSRALKLVFDRKKSASIQPRMDCLKFDVAPTKYRSLFVIAFSLWRLDARVAPFI